jgi:two-component system nitrogen regulation response regulator NtrX
MKQTGMVPREFSHATISALKNHRWPGNVRQLRNVVEWVVIMHGGQGTDDFTPEHLPPEFTGIATNAGTEAPSRFLRENYLEIPLREAREEFEREYLVAQVERFDGNISKTAQFVGMERSALHRKLKSLNAVSDKGDPSAGGNAETRRKRA